MYLGTILWEIACIRIRQRRILKALKDATILDWDGTVHLDDPEVQAVYKQLQETFDADNSPQADNSETKTP